MVQASPCQLAHVRYSPALSRGEQDELNKKLTNLFTWLAAEEFPKCTVVNWYSIDAHELLAGADFVPHMSPLNPFLRERCSIVLDPLPGFVDKLKGSPLLSQPVLSYHCIIT